MSTQANVNGSLDEDRAERPLPGALDRLNRDDFEACLCPGNIPNQCAVGDREGRRHLRQLVGMPRHKRALVAHCNDASFGRERLSDRRDRVFTRLGRPVIHGTFSLVPLDAQT